MKKIMLLSLVLLGAVFGTASAQTADRRPARPQNLRASLFGHQVTLTWENPEEGETLVTNNFEAEDAELGDDVPLAVDGWTVRTTNTSDFSCTWFNYPTSEYLGSPEYKKLVFDGERSAAVFIDLLEDGNHDMHQDEWLISPVAPHAAYLQFSYWVDPRSVLNGENPDFPDHYAVMVSTDGGETWKAIWDARYDGIPEDSWHTVTLALSPEPTDKMRVAFRAYGDYQVDENGDTINQSLYGSWAIDNVRLIASHFVENAVVTDFEDAVDGAEGEMNMTFDAEGWDVVKNVEVDPEDADMEFAYTWFKWTAMEGDESFSPYVLNGQSSAMLVLYGYGAQDEWLVAPVVEGARQLKFSYQTQMNLYKLAHPDASAEEDMAFTGGFEVYLSTDGGRTWGEEPIWKAADDDKVASNGEEIYEAYTSTVTVALPAGLTADARLGFRVHADMDGWGLVVLDDVVMTTNEESAVVSGYQVMLDNKELAVVESKSYVDGSAKTVGEHIYTVYALGAADTLRSEGISVKVDLPVIPIVPPKNFVCTSEFVAESGTYTVRMTWEAPEVDYQPVSYNIYSDRVSVPAFSELTAADGKEGVDRTGLAPGLYEYEIEAVYKTPDSVSERVLRRVALGVRYGVTDLQADMEGRDVVLSWQAPEASDFPMGTYTVYRGGEKLTEGLKETTWRDVAVADGLYEYVVIAVYADGMESVRTGLDYQVGEEVCVALPYEETFSTTYRPVNWTITNESDRTPDKYTWYFDDQSRLGVKGEGFDGGYAAIDCRNIGFYRINATLQMPAIDLTTATDKGNVTLTFNYSLARGGISKAGVEWSLDGKDWYLFDVIDTAHSFIPGETIDDFHIQQGVFVLGKEIRASDLDKADKIYIRFHYEAARSKYWAIDNVRISENTANEALLTDGSVRISASAGQMQVRADQAIEKVEVFARHGVKIQEVKGNGGLEMSLPVADRGPALVRVTTAKGVKVVKMLL